MKNLHGLQYLLREIKASAKELFPFAVLFALFAFLLWVISPLL